MSVFQAYLVLHRRVKSGYHRRGLYLGLELGLQMETFGLRGAGLEITGLRNSGHLRVHLDVGRGVGESLVPRAFQRDDHFGNHQEVRVNDIRVGVLELEHGELVALEPLRH